MASFLGIVQRRIEGLLFAVFLPLIVVFTGAIYLGARWRGRAISRPARTCSRRRWALFLRQGLVPLRDAWYHSLRLEPARHIWRHVLLMEGYEAVNAVAEPHQEPMPLPEKAKVLVISLTHLGDVLHVVPMLKSLRAQRPKAQIDLLVGPWCEALARRIPYVDNVEVYTPHFVLFHRGQREGCMGLVKELQFLNRLRREKYDLLVSVSATTLPGRLLSHAVLADRWIGATSPESVYWEARRAVTVPYDGRAPEYQRVAGLLALAGLQPGQERMEYWTESGCADELLAEAGVDRQDRYAVIAPGAGWPGKLWPVERFATVADFLAAECGLKVVVVGAAAERGLGEEMGRDASTALIDLVGQTDLDQLADILERSVLFVGNDSGPLHLAAAFHVPRVVLFGPSKASKWAPPEDRLVVLQKDYDCRGCWSWHPRTSCIHDRACMKRIHVDEVKQAVRNILERTYATRQPAE